MCVTSRCSKTSSRRTDSVGATGARTSDPACRHCRSGYLLRRWESSRRTPRNQCAGLCHSSRSSMSTASCRARTPVGCKLTRPEQAGQMPVFALSSSRTLPSTGAIPVPTQWPRSGIVISRAVVARRYEMGTGRPRCRRFASPGRRRPRRPAHPLADALRPPSRSGRDRRLPRVRRLIDAQTCVCAFPARGLDKRPGPKVRPPRAEGEARTEPPGQAAGRREATTPRQHLPDAVSAWRSTAQGQNSARSTRRDTDTKPRLTRMFALRPRRAPGQHEHSHAPPRRCPVVRHGTTARVARCLPSTPPPTHQ